MWERPRLCCTLREKDRLRAELIILEEYSKREKMEVGTKRTSF